MIRLADIQDLSDIRLIEKESFEVGKADRTGEIIKAIKNHQIYVHASVEGVKSYIWIRHNSKKNTVYIQSVATGIPYRSKGYCTTLIEHILERFASVEAIYLHVHTLNKSAINLYKRLGFVKIGYESEHYGKDTFGRGIDAYYMERKMK